MILDFRRNVIIKGTETESYISKGFTVIFSSTKTYLNQTLAFFEVQILIQDVLTK